MTLRKSTKSWCHIVMGDTLRQDSDDSSRKGSGRKYSGLWRPRDRCCDRSLCHGSAKAAIDNVRMNEPAVLPRTFIYENGRQARFGLGVVV